MNLIKELQEKKGNCKRKKDFPIQSGRLPITC